jgi:hypothetical protein
VSERLKSLAPIGTLKHQLGRKKIFATAVFFSPNLMLSSNWAKKYLLQLDPSFDN